MYIYTGGDVGAISSRLKHRRGAGVLLGRHQGVPVTDIDVLHALQLLARRLRYARLVRTVRQRHRLRPRFWLRAPAAGPHH